MLEVPISEYKKEFSICHYNLLASVSLLDFKAHTAHVVNYFTKTVEDVLKNYMSVDTSLFYEYIVSDISVYFDNLIRNTASLFNLLKMFSNKSDYEPVPVTIKSEDAISILIDESFIEQSVFEDSFCEERTNIYSTEIIQYINLTKIIQYTLNKFPSAIICFPFDHLKELFFSYNTVRLVNTITSHNIHPKLLNFNSLLYYIFRPHILEEDVVKVQQEVMNLEEIYKKEVVEREKELKVLSITLIEQGLSNLYLKSNKQPEKNDFIFESDSLPMNRDLKLELISIFLKRVIKYKYSLNNVTLVNMLKPYKSTLLNLFINHESKYITREFFTCLMMLLKFDYKIRPEIKLECLDCKAKKKWNYEGDMIFKDCLIAQVIKEAFFNNLIEEIDYSTCGCEILSFSEGLFERFSWLKIVSKEKKEKKEEEPLKFFDPKFDYDAMINDNINKNCKMIKNILHVIKYYYYLSVYTNANVIQYSTTHMILNVLKNKNFFYLYETTAYIMKYLYDTLFLCWCNRLDNKNHSLEPFIITIYKTIKEIRELLIGNDKLTNGNNYIEELCKNEMNKIFKDWESEEWITLRLGYLNNLMKKETLTYFDKGKIDNWLENCITEPFMRYVTYFICEDLPEHDFLD